MTVGEASGRLAIYLHVPVSIMGKFYASNIFSIHLIQDHTTNIFSIHLIQDHNNYFQYTFDTGSYYTTVLYHRCFVRYSIYDCTGRVLCNPSIYYVHRV